MAASYQFNRVEIVWLNHALHRLTERFSEHHIKIPNESITQAVRWVGIGKQFRVYSQGATFICKRHSEKVVKVITVFRTRKDGNERIRNGANRVSRRSRVR
jgi:hypothetical protein